MSAQHEFYLARAAEAKAAADTATLDNVRDRSLRSEAAWAAMAARAERSDKAREKIILQKASAASESEAVLRREA
ncbi:MAG TPA: hypothetical protein VGU70_09150 [Methylobacterium sp.]|jgi:hypothetical protein|nr:hypothetical protein [Methylobacterium sp.]